MDKPEVVYRGNHGFVISLSNPPDPEPLILRVNQDEVAQLYAEDLDALCAWWLKRNANTSTLTAEERSAIKWAAKRAELYSMCCGTEAGRTEHLQYEASLRNLMQRLDAANIASQTWTEAEIREASEHLAPPPGSWDPESDTWNDGYHEGYSNALRDLLDRLHAQKGGA